MNFEQYYHSIGFAHYPFSTYTAEYESDYAKRIYYKPDNYSIIEDRIKRSSVIITGERGVGKTALSNHLSSQFNHANTLLINIKDFSKLNYPCEEDNLYEFLIKEISSSFFLDICNDVSVLWKYSKDDRLALSFFLHEYVKATSREQLREKISQLQNKPLKRACISFYNNTRMILNYGLKAFTKTANDIISNHFQSLPSIDLNSNIDYFQAIKSEVDDGFIKEDRAFSYLEKISKLVLKFKYKNIVILLDKIDEDQRFKNDAEPTSELLKSIASNNNIMVNELYKIVLFAWSTPFNYIKSDVRTQKLAIQNLNWPRKNLFDVASKRLNVYSNNKMESLNDLFEEHAHNCIDTIISMCNENPRDLWHILDKCIKCQFEIDDTKKVTNEAVDAGIKDFVTNFNYYEYYPKKSNSRSNSMDVYSYIKHLSKLDSTSFTKDKFSSSAKTGSSTNNYVTNMEHMGLIKNTGTKSAGGGVIYEIKDPKVKYAITNGIEIAK